ncbi:VUT family protein [Pasteurella atlantica]|uniref:VUT family protein n=2 Tax=Pasteurellaceae TaxID=712 RepID=A0ACC6HL88_9PAST|nr:VUT family protein [Pasteurella atlantica]MDP8051568.1 VUT family protein [Pasteurella atlantica]MDP8104853.1 VUT family protein [Pasteurella atlantica]MDP8148227.1 VUT family protein [Pasteurella atlantica]
MTLPSFRGIGFSSPFFLVFLYVMSILLANLTLDTFITLPFYGMLSIGTIFFAAIFTLRDKIHFYGGLNLVYWAICIAVIVNIIVSYWLNVPSRFIFASFLSISVSELADTAVFHRFKHRRFVTRVLSSNALSVPLDSILFTFLAFYGVLPLTEIWQIIYADIIVKYGIAMLFIAKFWQFKRLQQA